LKLLLKLKLISDKQLKTLKPMRLFMLEKKLPETANTKPGLEKMVNMMMLWLQLMMASSLFNIYNWVLLSPN
jgi:hypothetical protein